VPIFNFANNGDADPPDVDEDAEVLSFTILYLRRSLDADPGLILQTGCIDFEMETEVDFDLEIEVDGVNEDGWNKHLVLVLIR